MQKKQEKLKTAKGKNRHAEQYAKKESGIHDRQNKIRRMARHVRAMRRKDATDTVVERNLRELVGEKEFNKLILRNAVRE